MLLFSHKPLITMKIKEIGYEMNKNDDASKNHDCIDNRFNIPNFFKFQGDLKTKGYSKLCMTEIVNSDMSIASFGEEAYYAGCAEVLENVKALLIAYCVDDDVLLYTHSYKRFILAANDSISDADFKKIIESMFDNFQHANADATPVSGVSRFVLVFGDDLINRAMSAHYASRNSQKNFILETNEKEICAAELQSKVEIFHLISYAIQHDTITPFYHGIRNNQTGEINKYEALMRLYDAQGNMYRPDFFMRVAKEFKQYNTISKMMLEKALNDFRDLDRILCLNITLFDIQVKEFKDWFLSKLSDYPQPEQLVLEFVETENYNNNSDLYSFLIEARKLGCKIAVDDFGSGFATFSSIISVKPDIIKVDGEIIKNLVNNSENKIILDSICFIARQINSHIVAEFVENDDIQKILLDKGIEFSQGFHFSVPRPLNEISAM